jgi:hypothetical protein
MVSSGTNWQCRVRRLFIDADVDQVDQRLEQLLELQHQLLVGDGHRRLRRQGFDETLVGGRKGADLAAAVERVDQLEHADQLSLMVVHRHRQERLRVVAEGRVELAHARKIEALFGIHVFNVDRLAPVGRIRGHRTEVRLARFVVQRHRLDVDRVAAGAALVDAQAVIDRDVEAQADAARARTVQGAAVGMGHGLGHLEDAVEQRRNVRAAAERDTDLDQQVEPLCDLCMTQRVHCVRQPRKRKFILAKRNCRPAINTSVSLPLAHVYGCAKNGTILSRNL